MTSWRDHRAGSLDRATVRRFVDQRIAPSAGEFEREEYVPDGVLKELGELGLWGAALPVSDGGGGVDTVTLGALHEEVGRGCSSVRSLLTVHSMVTRAVHRWGSPSQRAQWLPELAAGRALGAFCLSESHAGSDTGAITTSASRKGERWLLDGVKTWITGAQVADVLLVFARTDSGTGAFLVPRSLAGVEIRPLRGMLGTRGSMMGEVVLRDVDAGPEALLGPEKFGHALVMADALELGRYSVACGCVGIAQACLDASVAFTAERRSGEGRLSDRQLVRRKISDMATHVRAARLLCEDAGRLKDAASPEAVTATWMAKYFASRTATSAAGDAVQVHGAHGCAADSPVARYYRDAKVMEIIEGSSELGQIVIADEIYRRARGRSHSITGG